jgi:hypothetical protein
MSQARPALTVDIDVGGQGGRNIAGKIAAQARASAQGPSSRQAAAAVAASSSSSSPPSGVATIRPGDIISEEDFMAQGGFSSDEDDQDSPTKGASRINAPTESRGDNPRYQEREEGVSESCVSCLQRSYVLTWISP